MQSRYFRFAPAFLTILAAAARPARSQTAPAPKPFIHPGLMHTEADFARMKAKVDAKQQPWLDGWNRLIANGHGQLGWNPRPMDIVIRGAGPGQNYGVFYNDIHAAYQLALRWKVSGDSAYADKAISILNIWSSTLKQVSGNADRFLAAGIYGYEFANAAEIMRTYPGWAKGDFERFQNMMLTAFYPMNHDFLEHHNGAAITNYWANWDLCNIASVQAIGVLCDRRDIYDEATNYFKSGGGNGSIGRMVYYVHPGNLGQWQESGRDQGHNTLGISLIGPICETAWHQGDDLYGYDNNRVLAGAEYIAKYNLGNTVPYEPYAWGTGQKGQRQEQPVIAEGGRGNTRPGWELIVNHYVNRRGIAAPYSSQFVTKVRPEGGGGDYGPNSGGFDQLGFGTLTAVSEPQVANPKPSGLTAYKSGDAVVLSWWGAAGATSYAVKRATKAGGPYTTIAPDVQDPLTYADKDPQPATRFYVIAALRDGKESGLSNEVRISTAPVLRAQFKFDQTTGTTAPNAANPGQPGTINGAATWEPGKTGQCLSLNGRDAYVSLPSDSLAGLGDFTVSAWVFLNASQTWARIFDFGDGPGRYLFLTPRTANGKVRFAVSTVYGYNEQDVDGTDALPTGKWVHVALTLSGKTATLYVDGQPVGTNPSIDFPPYQVGNTSQNWIGRSQFPNDPYLNGKVDDLRIYDGALSAAQIAALSAGTP